MRVHQGMPSSARAVINRRPHSLFSSGISGSETKMNVATSDRPRTTATMALSATAREHRTGCKEPMLSRVARARGRMKANLCRSGKLFPR